MTAHDPARSVSLDALLEHREWVRALARSLVRDAHAADDVEQETWRMALERPPRHGGSLRAWFATVVRNAARGAGRRAASRARFESMAAQRADAASPADVVAEAEAQHRLVHAVLALDEPYRTAILLRYFQGLAASEIAARGGEPVETVRTRLKRAVERLRRALDVELGDERGAWLLLVAGHGAAPTGAGAGTLATTGGLAMGAATKVSAVAAAAVVLAAIAWTVTSPAAETREPTVASGGPVPQSESHVARVRSAAPADATSPAISERPVDLATADRDLDLHGVVVRRDGTPIAGAALAAVSYPWRRASKLNHDEWTTAIVGPTTRSAADGTFVLRLRRGECVALRVTAPGLAPVELSTRQAGERVRVVLGDAVALQIRVTDADDAPLAGATIEVLDDGQGPTSTMRRAATDAAGAALVDDLPADARLFVRCTATGHVASPRRQVDLPAAGCADVTIALERGRTVSGRLTDAATGAPVADAAVGVGWWDADTTSRADGTYALTGVSTRADDVVSVVARGYAPARDALRGRDVVDFSLRRGFAATGRVVGADGGAVAGALVAAVASPSENSGASCLSTGFATTGADGRFRIDGLDRQWMHVLTVTAAGHGRLGRALPAADPSADMDLGDVALPDARCIEGRVVDAKGNALASVPVSTSGPLGSDDRPPTWRTDDRVTDDLGRFRVHDLAPGRYLVVARPVGTARVEASVELPAGGDVLEVVLEARGDRNVVVCVVDEAGHPVRGALVRAGSAAVQRETDADGRAAISVDTSTRYVEAYGPRGDARDFLALPAQPLSRDATEIRVVLREGVRLTGRLLDPDGKPVRHALLRVRDGTDREQVVSTDEDGRFRAAVPPGATCEVRFDGIVMGRDTDLTGRADSAVPGAEAVIRCEHVATNWTLRVRVTDPSGAAVAGVAVWVTGDYRETVRTATTDADGRATVSGLAAREWTVTAASHGSWAAAKPVRAVADGREVVLTLQTAAPIRGVVVGKDGRGVRAVVAVHSGDRLLLSDVSSDDGAFALLVAADEPGPFRLTARSTDSAPGVVEAEIDAVAACASDVRLVLTK